MCSVNVLLGFTYILHFFTTGVKGLPSVFISCPGSRMHFVLTHVDEKIFFLTCLLSRGIELFLNLEA